MAANSSMDSRALFTDLFDLSTVLDAEDEDLLGLTGPRMGGPDSGPPDDMWAVEGDEGPEQSGVVTFPKLVFVDGKMSLAEDRLLCSSMHAERPLGGMRSLNTSASPRSPAEGSLKLCLVRGCGRNKDDAADFFSMPSLRLTAQDKSYNEPLRDRNKNWAIDSQREVLNRTPREERPALRLGQYPPPPTDPPPLQWAPSMQSMVRRQMLLRAARIVSDTHCIVEVFGVGVCGRVVATGQTKRVLIIEVLSKWNSLKYSLVVKVNQIKALFPGRDYLFKPGKKRQLVEALLDLLYFEYRVSYPAMLIDGRVYHPPVQELTHTDRAKLPEEYPASVCDAIAAVVNPNSWKPPELLDGQNPVPIIEQTLRISSLLRETALSKRRRERVAQMKQDLIDKEEERQAWLRTPKRLRGLRAMRCVRRTGKIFVLQAYVYPHTPEVGSLRGHAVGEVGRLRMPISLAVAGPLAGLSSPPQRWVPSTVRMVSHYCLRNIQIRGNFKDGFAYFDFEERRGGGAALLRPLHCFYRLDHIRRHSAMRLWLDKEDCAMVAGEPKETWQPYQNNDLTSALGACSSRGKPSWRPQCKPRRDIGRGQRLASRTRRFGAALGVYSVYAVSRQPRGAAPPVLPDGKTHPDLAPQLAIEIEVYFPYGAEVIGMDRVPLLLPAFTSIMMTFYRSDICAMTRRLRRYHDIAFRATYFDFYCSATVVEVATAEQAWVLLAEEILAAGRWAVQLAVPPPPPPTELENILYPESSEVCGDLKESIAPAFDFEMDESMLDAALGDMNPLQTVQVAVKLPDPEPDEEDSLAWMGGHTVEDLLARYVCPRDEHWPFYFNVPQDMSMSSIKMHIALGREAVVRVPAGIAERYGYVPMHTSISQLSFAPLLTWRWSTVIYNKVQQVGSESQNRLHPILQVLVWCVGREIGVIALDTERRGEVYFLRLVDYVQTPLCGTTQNLGPEELELCIEEMLKDIKYFEEGEHEEEKGSGPLNASEEPMYRSNTPPKLPENQLRRGGIRFVEATAGIEVEDAIVDNDEDMLAMVQQAEEAAQKRAEASAAIAAAKKEKEAKDAERAAKLKSQAEARKRARQQSMRKKPGDDDLGDGDDDDDEDIDNA